MSFSLNDAPEYMIDSLRVLVQINLGQVGDLSYWNADEVIIADRVLPFLLSRINIRTGETTHFLNFGRGPGEGLDVFGLTVQDKELYAYSISSRKIIVFQEEDVTRTISFVDEVSFDENCLRIIPTKTGGYIGTPYKGGRLFSFDENGAVVDTVGSFPVLKGEPAAVNNNAFQSRLAFSPDGKYFCSSYNSMDYIEIYSNNFKKLKRLWGPDSFVPRAVRHVEDGMVFDYGEPHKQVYSKLVASDSGFLVGYVGHTYKDRDDPSRCTKELFYFDWDGHFLARYLLPEEVAFFDVDWKNARMCGVTAGVEAKLVVAQLEGLNELSSKE